MATKLAIWPIFVIGVICYAIAGVLLAMFVLGDGVGLLASPSERLAVAVPLVAGLAAFRAGFAEYARARAGIARPEDRRRARRSPFMPAIAAGPAGAPRIGDDPFRDPPGRPPIVVERHPTAPIAAPIVPGDPSDRPKLLT